MVVTERRIRLWMAKATSRGLGGQNKANWDGFSSLKCQVSSQEGPKHRRFKLQTSHLTLLPKQGQFAAGRIAANCRLERGLWRNGPERSLQKQSQFGGRAGVAGASGPGASGALRGLAVLGQGVVCMGRDGPGWRMVMIEQWHGRHHLEPADELAKESGK